MNMIDSIQDDLDREIYRHHVEDITKRSHFLVKTFSSLFRQDNSLFIKEIALRTMKTDSMNDRSRSFQDKYRIRTMRPLVDR